MHIPQPAPAVHSNKEQEQIWKSRLCQKQHIKLTKVYCDRGISGRHEDRPGFQEMLQDARAHAFDFLITRSISRLARNTITVLKVVRELQGLGIGIYFEKENIHTLEAKGEVLLTILSSLAQDESRSISENCTWGMRRRFEQGEYRLATTRFLGYDQDAEGHLVINPVQSPIVKRIYQDFLSGYAPAHICYLLKKDRVKSWDGSLNWRPSTILSMLQNEKYKGDAHLQKTWSRDFLSKKRISNNGEIPSYYLKDDHDAIIDRQICTKRS